MFSTDSRLTSAAMALVDSQLPLSSGSAAEASSGNATPRVDVVALGRQRMHAQAGAPPGPALEVAPGRPWPCSPNAQRATPPRGAETDRRHWYPRQAVKRCRPHRRHRFTERWGEDEVGHGPHLVEGWDNDRRESSQAVRSGP